MTRSRYDVLRRWVAPIALVLALGWMAQESCREEERAAVTFRLDFGERAAEVRSVRVDLFANGEPVGFFERALPGGAVGVTVSWTQPVPREDLEAAISAEVAAGEPIAGRRRVHAPAGATVSIPVR